MDIIKRQEAELKILRHVANILDVSTSYAELSKLVARDEPASDAFVDMVEHLGALTCDSLSTMGIMLKSIMENEKEREVPYPGDRDDKYDKTS